MLKIIDIEKRKTLKKLQEIASDQKTKVIHYSCEAFEKGPRITSIAVRTIATGETKSFTYPLTAEKQGITLTKENYDTIEKELLVEFYTYVRCHMDSVWVHWNMTNANFGFPAIENRYNILTGFNDTDTFSQLEKINLAWAAIIIYGEKYIGHGRLQSLMELNEITSFGFMTGEEEARAFATDAADEYTKMHLSTLRKVDLIAIILSKISNRTLKTLKVKWYKKMRIEIFELITLLGAVASIVGVVALINSCLNPPKP